MAVKSETARLLMDLNRGDASAAERLMPLVYDELRALAASRLAAERPDHTLQPTALVHEAYLRLVEQRKTDWNDRAHFFAVASECIRRVLVDHARRHNAQKRGGGRQGGTLMEAPAEDPGPGVDVVALDEALGELRALSARQARIVELRFFGGMTGEQVAHVLGVSRSTVADDWAVARAWLSRRLGDRP